MAVTAAIVTKWVPIQKMGQDYRPKIVEDYPPSEGVCIGTAPTANIPADVNILIMQGKWTDAQFMAILADANYGSASVVWASANGGSGVKITQSDITDFGQLLISVHSVPAVIVTAAKNALRSGDTRAQLAAKLGAWLKQRPKAK